MTRWPHAMFSHGQEQTIVQEWSQALGRGLKAEKSNNLWLHVNLAHITPMAVCAQLGQGGWEMVGFTTLTVATCT